MNTATIETATIEAALSLAAKNDVRFYLNGVYLDPRGYVVATNGHALFAAACGFSGESGVILPRDGVALALKAGGKSKTIDIHWTGLDVTMGAIPVTGIDAQYPDWGRIISGEPPSGEAGFFNPDLLHLAAKALKIYMGSPARSPAIPIVQNGPESAGVMYATGALCIVMPMKHGRCTDSPREWLGLSKPNETAA